MTNPYRPLADLVPWGTREAMPSDAEERVVRDAMAEVWSRTGFLPEPGTRTGWYVYENGEYDSLRGVVIFEIPPVLLLQAGRRLEDLRLTALHEIRHLWQAGYHASTWTPAEREEDAEQFVLQFLRRDR